MDKSIDQIYQEALTELKEAASHQAVQDISVRYLGRKGIITQFLRNISKLPADQRPAAGKQANEVKNLLDAAFSEASQSLKAAHLVEDAMIRVLERGIVIPDFGGKAKTVEMGEAIAEQIEA